jgi:RNA polymerase sigma-70 factor (ECF subfamily)
MSNLLERDEKDAAGEPVRELVEQAQAGSQTAFNELVRAFQRPMFNLAFRMVNNREDADELTQEIFVRMYRSIGKFRGNSAFATWLYAIAVNTCRSRLRRLRRIAHFEVVRLDEERERDDFGPSHVEAVDPADPPGKAMERREIGEQVRKIVAAMPDELKTVIVLRDMQGLAYEEIAAALGCSVGTVKSRLFRARLRAKEKLSREGLLCAVKK